MKINYMSWILILATAISPAALAAEANTQSHFVNHLGGWVALAIVVTAVAISVLTNHKSPSLRSLGTFIAAFTCFGLVVWFVSILGTGILENPKPNQTPMDSAKPALLYLQVGIALVAGVLLTLRGLKQLRDTETLELSNKNNADRYGFTSRVMHWTTAILILSLFPLGIFATIIPEQFWFRNHYYVIHKTIGLTVIALVLLRILWNRRSKRPKIDSKLTARERKWAHRAHIGLYVLMLILPITGYVMTSYHGYPAFFFFWEVQPFWAESKAYIVWGLIHKYVLQYVLYLILGAHILGALKHHWIDKHKDALKRMIG